MYLNLFRQKILDLFETINRKAINNKVNSLKFKNSMSDWCSSGHGFGACFVSTLINETKNSIVQSDVMFFVDDTMLYFVGSNLEKLLDKINRDLDSISAAMT